MVLITTGVCFNSHMNVKRDKELSIKIILVSVKLYIQGEQLSCFKIEVLVSFDRSLFTCLHVTRDVGAPCF